MKIRRLSFKPAYEPIRALTTKFGGQPVWAEKPTWPRSASTGELMVFLGQVEIYQELLGGAPGRFAYLFMAPTEVASKQGLDTWAPDSGENAVVVQISQGGQHAVAVEGDPVVQQYVWDPAANHPILIPWEAEAFLEDDEEPDGAEPLSVDKLGGRPWWLQGDETPGPGWRLLLQMYQPNDTNMGIPGILYVFLSPDGLTGRLLWQC